jgi:glycosyltransferase involved in cell wall biosynthesis
MLKLGIASGDRISAKNSPDGNAHWGGAGWVRLGQYANRLHGDGFETYNGTLVWNKDRFSIDIMEGERHLVDVDIIYCQRLMHRGLEDHIKKAKAIGQIVINDLDDWYWGLSTENTAWRSSHPKTNPDENINHYKGVLNSSTVVTVSTPYLADRLKAFVHCPIVVLYNTIDVSSFAPVEHTDSTVPVVGWVGSTAHRSGDLETLRGIMAPLYNAGEIKLQHSGAHAYAPSVASKWMLPDEAVATLPATDPENYPSLLTMEVGIAPLNDIPFNHAKSDIKLLEYSAAGIPWVGSALSSYSQLVQDWGMGRVAKRPKDWIKHLKQLKDPNARSSEGASLREAVWKRDIGVGTKTMREFLESLSS